MLLSLSHWGMVEPSIRSRVASAALRAQAFALRRQGRTFQAIADELGLNTASNARYYYEEALAKRAKDQRRQALAVQFTPSQASL